MAAIEEAENAWRTLGDRLHLPCRDALHAHCRRPVGRSPVYTVAFVLIFSACCFDARYVGTI